MRPGAVVFLLAFALLVVAAAPSLHLRDGGELTAAAWSLSSPHGPGYPLWCLLARAATLVPVGEIATRANLLSSVLAALAAWAVYRAARAMTSDAVAAIAAPAILVADPFLFRQGGISGAHVASAVTVALTLWGIARASDEDPIVRARAGKLLALLAGLSLGLHPSLRLAVIGSIVALAAWRLRRGDRWPLLAPALVTVGAAVLLYLPVAAARGDHGAPATLSGLIHFLFHAHPLVPVDEPAIAPITVAGRAVAFALAVEGRLGVPVLALAAVGLATLARRRRPAALVVAWVIVLDALAIDEAALSSVVALAVAAGVGIAAATRRLVGAAIDSAAFRARAALVGVALTVVALLPAALDRSARVRLGHEPATWIAGALRDAPPRALVFARTTDLAAGLRYVQAAWGGRPDVTVIDRGRLADGEHVARAVARGGGMALAKPEVASWAARPERSRDREGRELLARMILRNTRQRAVLWEPGDDAPPVGSSVADAELHRVELLPVPAPAPRPLLARIQARLGGSRDPMVRRLEAAAITRLAIAFLDGGDELHAAPLLDAALGVRPDDPVAAIRLARIKARRGDVDGALRLVERVLDGAPGHRAGRLDAGRYRLELGDLDGAERELRVVTGRAPEDPAALTGLARVAHARGDDAAARALVERALTAAPADPDARSFAKQIE